MGNMPVMARKAVRRAENANISADRHCGKFCFDIAETEKRADGFGVIGIAETDFYHAVPCDMITVETLILCHMLNIRSFAEGARSGEYTARAAMRRAIGLNEEEPKI